MEEAIPECADAISCTLVAPCAECKEKPPRRSDTLLCADCYEYYLLLVRGRVKGKDPSTLAIHNLT